METLLILLKERILKLYKSIVPTFNKLKDQIENAYIDYMVGHMLVLFIVCMNVAFFSFALAHITIYGVTINMVVLSLVMFSQFPVYIKEYLDTVIENTEWSDF